MALLESFTVQIAFALLITLPAAIQYNKARSVDEKELETDFFFLLKM